LPNGERLLNHTCGGVAQFDLDQDDGSGNLQIRLNWHMVMG
jgi:hypothetical protein